jgi:Spy/CpxP family protein refolding chaperone
MRHFSKAVAAVAAVLFVASLSAQAKPDFSGKWTLVPDPAAAPADAGGGGRGGGRGGGGGGQLCGQECTIASDAAMLTITRTTQAGETKAMYMLNGSDSKNMQQGRGGATEVVSKAMWDGNKVSISTTRDFGGNSVTTKATLSVTGGELTIVNEGQGQAGPTTTTQKYEKG